MCGGGGGGATRLALEADVGTVLGEIFRDHLAKGKGREAWRLVGLLVHPHVVGHRNLWATQLEMRDDARGDAHGKLARV